MRDAFARPGLFGPQRRHDLCRHDPAQARFTNFSPFWDFVAGPMNAGAFGPGVLDKAFGPTAVFSTSPLIQNCSPFAGYQLFGEVNLDPRTKAMKVELFKLDGVSQFTQTLPAVGV